MPRHLSDALAASRPSSSPEPVAASLPTGWDALDRLLGGGWPGGALTELLGHGRCTLALSAVRQAQTAGQPVAWIDGTGTFCPPTAGVDLERLALVRPPRGGKARGEAPCWLAADLLLRSRAFGLAVLDLPPCRASLAVSFRLARQAAAARTVLLLLSPEAGVAGSAAGLLLHVRQRHVAAAWQRRALPPPPALEVTLRRHRGGRAGARVVFTALAVP
jgi:hypothetical protein